MSTVYTYRNKVLKNSANDKWLIKAPTVDPYNPLGLPDNTIRVKFLSGYTPTMGDTQTLVDADENIWDIYKESNNWNSLFSGIVKLLEILGANTTNVTNMDNMFRSSRNVQRGALALYQQASSQPNPPSSHSDTFLWCGVDTVTGAAELAQIPSGWGGTGA